MNVEPGQILVVITIFIHFISFIRVFTTLEKRLTALETSLSESQKILKTITDNLINVGLVERRHHEPL
jgi:hypothetical protein